MLTRDFVKSITDVETALEVENVLEYLHSAESRLLRAGILYDPPVFDYESPLRRRVSAALNRVDRESVGWQVFNSFGLGLQYEYMFAETRMMASPVRPYEFVRALRGFREFVSVVTEQLGKAEYLEKRNGGPIVTIRFEDDGHSGIDLVQFANVIGGLAATSVYLGTQTEDVGRLTTRVVSLDSGSAFELVLIGIPTLVLSCLTYLQLAKKNDVDRQLAIIKLVAELEEKSKSGARAADVKVELTAQLRALQDGLRSRSVQVFVRDE